MTRRHWGIIGLLSTIFTLALGWLQWWKYAHFGYNGLDLGIYSQVVWSLAHGHGFASSIHDPSYLGDHLELWLIPMSWLYRLWQSPLVLLWLQTLLIASSTVPIARLANRYLGSRFAVIAVALFLINPLVYNVAAYEFHALSVALPLLFWSIWWYTQHRYVPWVVCLIGTLLVREDMPFVVFGWGVMAIIDRRGWRWWLPPLAAAAAWFPFAQMIIRHANHDGGYKYLAFYRWLGESPGSMLLFPLRHPVLFLQHVVSINNLGTVLGLALTFGFLPLLRARRLWPLLLVTAQMLIGNNPPMSFLRIHYTIPFLPFLAWASLEAVRAWRAGQLFSRFDRRIVGLLISISIYLSPIYASFIFGVLEWPWTASRQLPSTTPATLQRAIQVVEPNDRVLSTFALLPKLANRPALYSLNYVYLGRRQYSEIPYTLPTDIDVAIVDWQQLYEYQLLYRSTVFNGRDGIERIRELLAAQNLGVYEQFGTVTIYRRGGAVDRSAQPLTTQEHFEPKQVFGSVALLGQPRIAVVTPPGSSWREVTIQTAWQALTFAPDTPTSIRYELQRAGRPVATADRIIGQGPWQSSTWPVGSRWETRSTMVIPETLQGTFELTAEVLHPEGHYVLDRWRTFRTVVNKLNRSGSFKVGSLTLE